MEKIQLKWSSRLWLRTMWRFNGDKLVANGKFYGMLDSVETKAMGLKKLGVTCLFVSEGQVIERK